MLKIVIGHYLANKILSLSLSLSLVYFVTHRLLLAKVTCIYGYKDCDFASGDRRREGAVLGVNFGHPIVTTLRRGSSKLLWQDSLLLLLLLGHPSTK